MNRIVSEVEERRENQEGLHRNKANLKEGPTRVGVWGSQRALTSGPEWGVLGLITLQSLGLEATVSSPFPSPNWDRVLMSMRPFTLLHRWAPKVLASSSLHPFLCTHFSLFLPRAGPGSRPVPGEPRV